MEGHHQGPAGPQAAAGADRTGDRPRRHLHLRHVRPDRHPAQHLLSAVQQRLPEHRLPGPRGRRSSRQQAGADATRNPICRTSLLASVRRSRASPRPRGRSTATPSSCPATAKPIADGRRADLGVSFDPDPQLSSLRIVAGRPAGDLRRRRDGRRDRQEVRLQGGAAGPHPARRGAADLHHHRHRPVRHRQTTWPGPARRLHAAHRAGGSAGAGPVRRPSTSWPPRGRQGPRCSGPSPRSCRPGCEVVTGRPWSTRHTSPIGQALSFFSTALLVFAFISLFVGAFTILNTFSIIVGQRTRELALLRIVGASRRQVFRSVLAEAAIVGLVSSLIGLGLGVLAALGLEALLRGFGITLPSGPLVFEPRTVLVGLAVGVGVTVVAAIRPARNAVRDPSRGRAQRPSGRRRRLAPAPVRSGAPARRPWPDRRLLAVGLAEPAIAAGGRRRGRHLRRCRDARPGGRPPVVQRDRAPAGPLARGTGQARAGELDAQPSADRPDRLRADGRPGPGRRPCRCSAPRCRSRRPAASTRRSAPTSSSTGPAGPGTQRLGPAKASRPCRASPRPPPSTAGNSSSGSRSTTLKAVSTAHLADTSSCG